ncbi:MAG: hypothetical protein UV60_C0013G0015 [Parcubacteria group bacterium GW2011_GWA2_43_11]|nr:MAG: hypothetical protein UV60_C0013G0015 [Parcubacteria group bacterium GW2011_GWA2_43_11]
MREVMDEGWCDVSGTRTIIGDVIGDGYNLLPLFMAFIGLLRP